MKKVVVTGGAGFIGSHLVEELLRRGYEVHVVDNLYTGKREYVDPKAILHEVDIRNLEELKKIFKGAEYVFHLAAIPAVQYSIDDPMHTNEVNVTGTLNVLMAAREAGVKKVIFSSSASVYGDQETMPLHEEMRAEPLSPYALHKYIGERFMKLFHKVYNVPTVSLRYFNVYGPRAAVTGSYPLVIAKFVNLKSKGEPLTVTGDGKQTRDYVHVRDIARANIIAAENESLGKGEVINIGSGKPASVLEVAEIIGGPIEYIPPRLEPMHSHADTRLAKELLNWEVEIELKEGISELLQ